MTSLPARAAWAARLGAISYVDSAKAWQLLETLGPESLDRGSSQEWSNVSGVSPAVSERWRREALEFDVEAELAALAAVGGKVYLRGEADYPPMLAALADAPLALYVQGEGELGGGVAIVGTRAPSHYGRRMARRLAADLALRRITVISGLARGIDSEAHQQTLDSGGRTIAVLGSGLGRIYPPENKDLARRIIATGGCIVSEFPAAVGPHHHHFPLRNRIVAALSRATVVVEGRRGSGALITADRALECGREVLAVPGPADSPLSEAPHHLLRNGARLAVRIEDVLEALPPELAIHAPARRRKTVAATDRNETLVLKALTDEPLSLEEIGEATGLDRGSLSLIMFGLEIRDLVRAAPGSRYGKKITV